MIIHHYQYHCYAFCLILISWPIKKHHVSAASWRDLTVQNLPAHSLCRAYFILIHNSNGFLSKFPLPTFSTFIFASVLLGSSILRASLQSTPSASPSACCRIHPGSHLPSGNWRTMISSPRWEWFWTVSNISACLHLPNCKQLHDLFSPYQP